MSHLCLELSPSFFAHAKYKPKPLAIAYKTRGLTGTGVCPPPSSLYSSHTGLVVPGRQKASASGLSTCGPLFLKSFSLPESLYLPRPFITRHLSEAILDDPICNCNPTSFLTLSASFFTKYFTRTHGLSHLAKARMFCLVCGRLYLQYLKSCLLHRR